MDSAVRWLWRVTGRKKAYVLVLTLVQAVSGGLGVLFALFLRNIVDSAVGQTQRLAVARAVFSDCPVLLLDESTSALDELTEQRLLQNLRAMTDMTVVVVTHRRAALSICDRVLRFTEAGIEDVTGATAQGRAEREVVA